MPDILNWETNDLHQLLNLLVGQTYGSEPEKRLFVNLHYHSKHTMKKMAQDIGFQVQWIRTDSEQTFIRLNKP